MAKKILDTSAGQQIIRKPVGNTRRIGFSLPEGILDPLKGKTRKRETVRKEGLEERLLRPLHNLGK
jgi:hypothetical protein